MAIFMTILLIIAGCFVVPGATYNTSLSMCGNPSNPKTTSKYTCTGPLFTLVDINSLNKLKNQQGCLAGMMGLSTQLKGYHCLAMKNCPGAGCTCEVRQGCSSASTSDDTEEACLYGVDETNDCPADAGLAPSASSASSRHFSAILMFVLIGVSFLAADASYNTSLDMCGSPSAPKTTSGYECTGSLFTLVDINSFNKLKNEQGCMAGMLGLSTQLKGYHCLAMKNCPGPACTCEVRQGCSSTPAADAQATKACLYGVSKASECPADAPAGLEPSASTATSDLCSVFIAVGVALLCVMMTVQQ